MGDRMSQKVTLRQKRAIEALLTTPNLTEAASVAGVSRKTLYKWLKQPAFQQALQQAEQEALAALQRRLVALGSGAADALEQAMRPTEETRYRLRASDIVLGRLLQLRELVELEARIAALEQRLSGEGPGGEA